MLVPNQESWLMGHQVLVVDYSVIILHLDRVIVCESLIAYSWLAKGV